MRHLRIFTMLLLVLALMTLAACGGGNASACLLLRQALLQFLQLSLNSFHTLLDLLLGGGRSGASIPPTLQFSKSLRQEILQFCFPIKSQIVLWSRVALQHALDEWPQIFWKLFERFGIVADNLPGLVTLLYGDFRGPIVFSLD